jgi:hypothetical protein
MTIHKAGTMLTLTNELGTLRGALVHEWDTAYQKYPLIVAAGQEVGVYSKDWTITPDCTLPTTLGSVVRGDADGWDGELFALSANEGGHPWYRLSGGPLDTWHAADQITNWTLLFDAEVSE